MKDFYLTPRGDLAINSITNDYKKLEINFITSFSNALCLNFFIEDTMQKKPNSTSININFKIDKPEYDKEIKIISGDEAIEQAIKIRLSSALGSIRENVDIGSNLEEIMHELIDNESVIPSLKASIKNAISDIIPNPIIMLEKPKSKYVSYNTSFKVIIIDKDKQYSITF